MKQFLKYQTLIIAGKLRVDIRITIDDTRSPIYIGEFNGDKSTSISLFPIVSVSLTKPSETDDNGNKVKSTWNPNDSLGMTKFQFPMFIDELKSIQKDLKIVELYHYPGGKRLEINEEIATKIRRVFPMGNVTIELSAVVIVNLDDARVEGIKMKFNNEQSSVLLTLNELDSLVYNLERTDVDSVSLLMYTNYASIGKGQKSYEPKSSVTQLVDINPKE